MIAKLHSIIIDVAFCSIGYRHFPTKLILPYFLANNDRLFREKQYCSPVSSFTMAQWPQATKAARQEVPKRDAAKHITHCIHQTLLKTTAKCTAPLFVAPATACNHHFSNAGAALVTLQLPLCDHCLQLHCSAPCVHTEMQHSCYKFKMQC